MKKPQPQSAHGAPPKFHVLIPGLVIGIAAMVCVGWLTQSEFLVRLDSQSPPMQFSAALSFLLLGAAYLLYPRPALHWAAISLAGTCLLFSGTATVEYTIGVSGGLDSLFNPSFITEAPYAGRMGPNTTLAFSFLSLALLLILTTKRRLPLLGSFCAALFSISLAISALLGYLINLESVYSWSEYTPMAIQTAACHALLGGLLLAHLNRLFLTDSVLQRVWEVGTTYGLGTLVSIILFMAAQASESNRFTENLRRGAKARAGAIQNTIDTNTTLLKSVERFFVGSEHVSAEEFRTFVAPFIGDKSSIVSLDWAPRVTAQERAQIEAELRKDHGSHFQSYDKNVGIVPHPGASLYFPIIYTEPSGPRDQAFGFDHYSDPLRAEAMDEAARNGQNRSTPLLQSLQLYSEDPSKHYFLILLPVYSKDRTATQIRDASDASISGFIVGVFCFETVIEQALREFSSNGPAIQIFPKPREQTSQPLFSYIPPDEQERLPEIQSKELTNVSEFAFIGGRTYELVFSPTAGYLSRQRSSFPIIVLISSLAIALLSATYVSLLRRQREQLKEREAWFHQLSLSAPLGIFRTDAQGNTQYVNPAWSGITHVGTEEAKEFGWMTAVHPEDLPPVSSRWREAIENNEEFELEFRYRQPSGAERWVAATARPVFTADKVLTGHVGTIFDITERKENEQKLQRALAFQRAMVDEADYSIISTDRNGKIVLFNRAAERMLGYKAEEVVNRDPLTFIHDPKELLERAVELSVELNRPIRPDIEALVTNACLGAPEEREWTYIRKDGSRFPVSLSVSALFDDNQQISGFMGIAKDISQQKEFEKALQTAKENAELATEAKSRFLANMSHEIRTPLTSIIGFTESIMCESISKEEERIVLGTVLRNSKHLLRIINDILDLSKIEAGRLEVEMLETDLAELVYDVENLLRYRAEEKGIFLGIEYALPLPVKIRTDPTRLKQILINLAGNAVKFTETGGVKICLAFNTVKEYLQISIVDTGIGMSEEQQKNLFRAFAQADTSTSRKFGGTGLGLVISNELARKLGGSIKLNSQKGRGSEFTLTIPTGSVSTENLSYVRPKQTAKLPPLRLTSISQLQGRLLIAEDGEDNKEYLHYLLKKTGLSFTFVEHGALAVEAVQRGSYDLILMDLQMPLMDGYEATRKLRGSGCTTPIIALTANATKEDIDRAMQCGCTEYFAKPFERDLFFELLARYLEQKDSLVETKTGTATKEIELLHIDEDPELMSLLLQMINRLPQHIIDIERAFQDEDYEELGRRVHKLKGSCMFFPTLFSGCGALETAAQNARRSQVAKALEDLKHLARELERTKESWHRGRQPAS